VAERQLPPLAVLMERLEEQKAAKPDANFWPAVELKPWVSMSQRAWPSSTTARVQARWGDRVDRGRAKPLARRP
jgi:hypothetical protein